MKKLLLLFLLALPAMAAMAQADSLQAARTRATRTITGILVDRDTKEALPYLTVQLLKTDSAYVAGIASKDDGSFSLQAPQNGSYLLKLSGVGYVTSYKRIVIADDHDLDMGQVVMGSDAVMLSTATVTGQALKVTMHEDTFVYNSAAYRVPEGSVVEELVKRLPGAQVDDDGKITINGKEVKKVLVDGKEFMTGDTKTAMKNLPTSIIDRIKAYDEKSDLSKVTGIDDGEEQTVLDFGLKKGMNRGMFSNIDVAVGSKSRYAERLMAAYFNSKWRFMGFGNANNTNDMGFGGRGGGFGRGRNGLNASKMGGLNMNYEEKDKLKADASVRWNHSDGDTRTRTATENYVTTNGAFSNSLSQSYSRSNSWDARGRIEWTPDTMTNIMFRPSFSYSTSDGRSTSNSASYNEDPYNYVSDPLSTDAIDLMAADSLMVNSRQNQSMSYSSSKNARAMLQYNRKLGSKGRNVTARADVSWTDSKSKSLSTSNVHLYQMRDLAGNDSTYQTNRYSTTPTKSYSYSLEATYSEPLWKATFLQLRYRFQYSFNKSDRATYDFSNLGEAFFSGVTPHYRYWDGYLGLLQNPLDSYYDDDLSRYSEYKNYTHNVELMFRMIREKFNFNAGVMVQPQRSHFIQDYQGVKVDTTRTVTNVTPTLDFRYRFSKTHTLRINYRGSTSQPSMTQLLDITDDSDPLNISKGNPGLKPSFTQTLRVNYNRSNVAHYQQMVALWYNFSTTRNSISNMVTYDALTGGRTTQPQNINGNWNTNLGVVFNTALDTAGYWNVNSFTNFGYNNYVGYVTLDRNSSSQKNTTRDYNLNERLAGSYRNDWLEVELDGSLNWRHSKNKLQSNGNSNVWQFAYGANINVTTPWNMSISTDIHENSRRGYSDNAMNTNELVWNFQVAQSFLKGKPLTVSLQFYDILAQQSNLSRSISAMMRSDTEYNAINSYVMLHAIYRLNIFGGKQNRPDGDRPGPDFRRGGPGGRPGGGPGGGGRPPRGGFGGPM